VSRRPGALVLVSTPIGNLADLSPRASAVLAEADVVACEDTRHTGMLLSRIGVKARRLVSLHAHNEAGRAGELVGLCLAGSLVAVVSDAGTPALSDPGERLVVAAAAAGVEVRAVPGPSAALCALVVSGLPTARWRFEGFLPRKGRERRQRLGEIARSPCTSVCFEAPGRLAATLDELAEVCGGGRAVAVCRELTKLHEETWRGSLAEAAARAAASEPRGEHVLVIAAGPDQAAAPGLPLDEAARRLVEAGLSTRDARLAAQVLLGASRAEAYEAVRGAADGPGEAGADDRR